MPNVSFCVTFLLRGFRLFCIIAHDFFVWIFFWINCYFDHLERKGQATKVPGKEMAGEQKDQGANWPASYWLIRSRERKVSVPCGLLCRILGARCIHVHNGTLGEVHHKVLSSVKIHGRLTCEICKQYHWSFTDPPAITHRPHLGAAGGWWLVGECGELWGRRLYSSLIMVALWNRADHYIFMLWFVLSSSSSFFSSPNLSHRRLDVYHTSAHGVVLV